MSNKRDCEKWLASVPFDGQAGGPLPGERVIDKWSVQVLGSPDSRNYEISVISSTHGRHHEGFGWGDERKHIICHNGGPCATPIRRDVWDAQIDLAERMAEKWNE